MDNVGGNNNGGGFHGYRRFPPPTPANTEMSMGLSAHLNQAIAAAAANTNNNTTNNTEDSECTVREQDRFMPIANVIRIMRRILPSHAKISDDAKETIQECVSEFISFITGEANERCQREQRKTITAEDVLWAMSKLGFDDYIEPLTLYLHRYREFDGGERGSLRGEPLLMKRAMVDPATGMTMAPYPPPFAMAHHHGYFAYPPPMSNGYMHRDVSNGSTSQGAATTIVENVDSLAEDGKE